MDRLICVLVSLTLLTQAQAKEKMITGLWDVGYASSDVFSTSGSTIYRKPVFQTWLSLTNKTGLYVKMFATISIKEEVVTRPGDEADFFTGFTKNLKGIDLDTGYARYYPHDNNTGGDTNVVYLGTTFPAIWKVKSYASGEIDMRADRSIKASQPDLIYQVGLKPEIKLGRRKVVIDFSAGGSSRSGTVNFLRLAVSTAHTISGAIDITPQINFQRKLNDLEPGVENIVWVTIDCLLPMF